jgi:hypothetical protein
MSTSAERMRRLRERRAAEIESGGSGGPPRDPDELLLPDVEKSLAALELGPQDEGMAQLARRMAAAIDEAQVPASALRWIGPELLKVLESLGGSPMARSRLPKQEQPHQPSKLDELRLRRVSRATDGI